MDQTVRQYQRMSGTGRNVMDKKQTKKIQDMPEAEEMDRLIEEGGFSMSNIDKYYGKDVCDKIREYTSAIDKMQAEAYEKIKQYDGVDCQTHSISTYSIC